MLAAQGLRGRGSIGTVGRMCCWLAWVSPRSVARPMKSLVVVGRPRCRLGVGNKRIVVNGLGWIHMQTDGTCSVSCLSDSQAFHLRWVRVRIAAACRCLSNSSVSSAGTSGNARRKC